MNTLEKSLEILTNSLSIAALESEKVNTEIALANEHGFIDSLDRGQIDALQTARKEIANALSTLDGILKAHAD